MTILEWFDKWNGKGIDFDGKFGFQCVDVYRQFVKEVLEAKQSISVTGAKDVWTTFLPEVFDQIKNSPKGVPQLGDVVIWGDTIGVYGHVGICRDGNVNAFVSFDQNWPRLTDLNGNGLGVCHFQDHNYNGVSGWLRPKSLPQASQPSIIPPPTVIEGDQVKINLGEKIGIMEVQAVKSKILDLLQTITDMATEEAGFKTQIEEMIKSRQTLAEKLQCADDFAIIIAEVQKLIEKEDQLNNVTESPVEKFISALLGLFKGRK